MVTLYTATACKDGWCCNGRDCRMCGRPICRPVNWKQTGMHKAVVCDQCWLNAATSFKMGTISMNGVARLFGVRHRAVQTRFNRIGLPVVPSYKEGARRWRKRHYQRDPAKASANVTAYQKSPRGREQHNEAHQRYRLKRKQQKEFANGVN